MKRQTQWQVQHAATKMDITVHVNRDGSIELSTPNLEIGPETLTPLEACELANALLGAARVSYEKASRRMAGR